MARLDARDVLPLARHALDRGASSVRTGHVHWDVSGRCQSPRSQERHAAERSLADGHATALGQRQMLPITVTMEVPCRKCPARLRYRARLWALRAQAEITAAPRTWFATITLSPDAHYTMLMRARRRLALGGTTFENLSPLEQFAERHREISQELTLWLKRIRKNSGAPLRLLLVAEAHKSGLPHYHGLIHEQDAERQVKHALLAASWPHGFTKFKLVPSDEAGRKTAWYVCKYLTKDQRARVRASLNYGEASHEMLSNLDVRDLPSETRTECVGNRPPERDASLTTVTPGGEAAQT